MADQTYINAAGINNIYLYENKGVNFIYSAGVVTSVGVPLVYTYIREDEPKYERVYQNSNNYSTSFQNTIQFRIPKFDLTTSATVQALKNTYYGWIVEIEFLNGLRIVFKDPFFFTEDANKEYNNNVFICTLQDRINSTNEAVSSLIVAAPADAMLADDSGYILADDNTYILAD